MPNNYYKKFLKLPENTKDEESKGRVYHKWQGKIEHMLTGTTKIPSRTGKKNIWNIDIHTKLHETDTLFDKKRFNNEQESSDYNQFITYSIKRRNLDFFSNKKSKILQIPEEIQKLIQIEVQNQLKSVLKEATQEQTLAHPQTNFLENFEKDIENMYSIEKKTEVFEFMRHNSFLVPTLKNAFPRIQKSFPDADIKLKLVEDPEIQDLTQLVACVMVEDDPDQFYPKLMQIQKEWLSELIRNTNQKFILDVELV